MGGRRLIMSLSTLIKKELQAFKQAAKANDIVEMERILAIEAVEMHIVRGSKILKYLANKGCVVAVQLLIDRNLILPNSSKLLALASAIQGNHLQTVKLFIETICKDYSFIMLPRLTTKNLETMKFMLSLSKVKETLQPTYFFAEILKDAIYISSLEIVEALLTIQWPEIYLLGKIRYSLKVTNLLQLAFNLNHFEIAYCLADKIHANGPQLYFKKYIVKGQGMPMRDFLKAYEQEMLLKVFEFNEIIKGLNLNLTRPLTQLILDYYNLPETIPSKFRNNINILQSQDTSSICSSPTIIFSMALKSLDKEKTINLRTKGNPRI